MRKFIVVMLLAAVSNSAIAEFTCEKIKDKATRASCIKDRVEKENAAAVEKEMEAAKKEAAAAEKEAEAAKKEIAIKKSNDLNIFVSKSKALLTRNFKDPASAQFTNLVVSVGGFQRTLCGSVNGKNSYGAYVGFKKFYVAWSEYDDPVTWQESDEKESGRFKYQIKDYDLFELMCEPSQTNRVTKIDE